MSYTPLTNPLVTIRTLLNTPDIIDEDLILNEDGLPCTFTTVFDYSAQDINQAFTTYDILIVLGLKEATISDDTGVYGTAYTITVTPYAMDKTTGITGRLRVTASKVLWAISQEILRVLNENRIGSYRYPINIRPERQGVEPYIIHGRSIEVIYIQPVPAYGDYTLSERRFATVIRELRIGSEDAEDMYSSIGASSGLSNGDWEGLEDPLVEVNNYELQDMGEGWKEGSIDIRDIKGIRELIRTQNVIVDAEPQDELPAVESDGTRNEIGYMAIIIDVVEITNTTNIRVATTNVYEFSNAVITTLRRRFGTPMGAHTLTWKFLNESETET